MHGLLDDLVVGAALLASVIYAATTLGPRGLRRLIFAGGAAVLRRLPPGFGLSALAERLRIAAVGKTAGGCGGCGDCAPKDGEIRIPLSRIGRR